MRKPRDLKKLLIIVLKETGEYRHRKRYQGLCHITMVLQGNKVMSLQESLNVDNYIANQRMNKGIYWRNIFKPYRVSQYQPDNIIFFWKPYAMKCRVNWLKKQIKLLS